MKLSSHLYFRTDGSLGRFPIIDISPEGEILSIEECGATLRETAHQQFVAGILVPAFTDRQTAQVALRRCTCREEFIEFLRGAQKLGHLRQGEHCPIDIIQGVNLNTFEAEKAEIQCLVPNAELAGQVIDNRQ